MSRQDTNVCPTRSRDAALQALSRKQRNNWAVAKVLKLLPRFIDWLRLLQEVLGALRRCAVGVMPEATAADRRINPNLS